MPDLRTRASIVMASIRSAEDRQRVEAARPALSDQPAVIGPVQQRLALAAPAQEVAGLAMFADLVDVATHRRPTPDLARVVGHTAAEVIAAVPLKPATGVVRMDPTLLAPNRQRLAPIDAVEVQRRVAPTGR